MFCPSVRHKILHHLRFQSNKLSTNKMRSLWHSLTFQFIEQLTQPYAGESSKFVFHLQKKMCTYCGWHWVRVCVRMPEPEFLNVCSGAGVSSFPLLRLLWTTSFHTKHRNRWTSTKSWFSWFRKTDPNILLAWNRSYYAIFCIVHICTPLKLHSHFCHSNQTHKNNKIT